MAQLAITDAVACPYCGAGLGVPCHVKAGHPTARPHKLRLRSYGIWMAMFGLTNWEVVYRYTDGHIGSVCYGWGLTKEQAETRAADLNRRLRAPGSGPYIARPEERE